MLPLKSHLPIHAVNSQGRESLWTLALDLHILVSSFLQLSFEGLGFGNGIKTLARNSPLEERESFVLITKHHFAQDSGWLCIWSGVDKSPTINPMLEGIATLGSVRLAGWGYTSHRFTCTLGQNMPPRITLNDTCCTCRQRMHGAA